MPINHQKINSLLLKSNYFFNYLSVAFIDEIKKCLAVNIAPTLDRFIGKGDNHVFLDKTRLEIGIQL